MCVCMGGWGGPNPPHNYKFPLTLAANPASHQSAVDTPGLNIEADCLYMSNNVRLWLS